MNTKRVFALLLVLAMVLVLLPAPTARAEEYTDYEARYPAWPSSIVPREETPIGVAIYGLSAESHDWVYITTAQLQVTSVGADTATCTSAGGIVCTATGVYEGHTFSVSHTYETPALDHDLVHHDARPATCTEVGWETEGDACSRCSDLNDGMIPALGHDWVVVGELTLDFDTDIATVHLKCQRNGCGATKSVDAQPGLYDTAPSYDETSGVLNVTYSATVELDGKAYTAQKTTVGTISGEHYILHWFKPDSTYAGTINGNSKEELENATYSGSDIAPSVDCHYTLVWNKMEFFQHGITPLSGGKFSINHSYKRKSQYSASLPPVNAVEATCVDAGHISGYECPDCHKHYWDAAGKELINDEEWNIPAVGHVWVTDPAKEATCTNTGLTEGKHCTRCGMVEE